MLDFQDFTMLYPISKALLFSSLNLGMMPSMVSSIFSLSKTSAAAALKAPAPPLGWKGEEPWPFVTEAKDRLAQRLPNGSKVELRFDERAEDRHGHLVAQVYVVEHEERA